MGIVNNALAGASGQGGYFLSRSLRFRSSASAFLNRTPASNGSLTTWTFSTWIKLGSVSTSQTIMAAGLISGTIYYNRLTINSDGTIGYFNYPDAGPNGGWLTTAQVLRDPSSWYHLVFVWDTTNATSTERMRIFVNGTRVTNFITNTFAPTYPSQNTTSQINSSSYSQRIGRTESGQAGGNFLDSYLAEVNFIDGQALAPSAFGMNDPQTGVWEPKKYTGTYGTNGFYLPFTDTSSTTNLVRDSSGNGNHWTPNNISLTAGSTYDSMTDVPTLTSETAANYAVLNPLNSSSSMTLSGGNLNVATSGVSVSAVSTIAVNSGKWYCEITVTSAQDSTILGIAHSDRSYLSGAFYNLTGGVGYYQDGTKIVNGSQSSYGASYTANDVIGIALDMDAGTVVFYKNNTSQGTAASGLTGGYYFAVGDGSSGSNTSYNVNFGQRPFAYTPPTGFKALNTFNLPTPTIGATPSSQANKYFDVSLYTGNSGTQSVTNSGSMQPDWVWIKRRSAIGDHALIDSVRGGNKTLASNNTDSEGTQSFTLSFNSNGFSFTSSDSLVNGSGVTYTAWQWRANGAAVTNTAGSITSTVSANTTAGFSIVTYTGNGTGGATIGHGLGVAPSMMIFKTRNGAGSWLVWHTGYNSNQAQMLLDSTAAIYNPGNGLYFNSTYPSSTVATLGTSGSVNGSGTTYVAYMFAQVAGYSRFGSYTGNGSSDGPFVFTGFRPRYVLIKRSDSAEDWIVMDTARNTANVANSTLFPNGSFSETTDANRQIDVLSNGFKIRSSGVWLNASGGTFIYMAFAEHPFKYSLAR